MRTVFDCLWLHFFRNRTPSSSEQPGIQKTNKMGIKGKSTLLIEIAISLGGNLRLLFEITISETF